MTEDSNTDFDLLQLIIPALTSLVIFILGYLSANYTVRIRRRKEKSHVKDFLLTQLRLLQGQIRSQKNQNIDCIKRLASFESQDLRLYKETGRSIDRLRSIPFKDQFEILVLDFLRSNRQKNEDYNKQIKGFFDTLQSSLDYIEVAFNILFQNNDMVLKEINSTLELWNQGHRSTVAFKNKITPADPSINDPFFIEISRVLDAFGKKYGKGSQNIENGYNDIILPLIEICKKYSIDERSSHLMYYLQDSKHAYVQIAEKRKEFRDSILDITRQLMKEYRKLKRLLDFYS